MPSRGGDGFNSWLFSANWGSSAQRGWECTRGAGIEASQTYQDSSGPVKPVGSSKHKIVKKKKKSKDKAQGQGGLPGGIGISDSTTTEGGWCAACGSQI